MALEMIPDDELVEARSLDSRGIERTELRRALRQGDIVRIRRAAYFRSHAWQELDDRGRHIVRMRAVALSHSRPVFGFESAAALLGLPVLGAWPREVHLVAQRATGGRSEPGIRRHCLGWQPRETVLRDGLTITTPTRTAIDLARNRSFESAVVVLDALLAGGTVSVEELSAAAPRAGRGVARVRRALAFANGLSESPGESLSRVRMRQFGFVAPQLQVVVRVRSGERYVTDFLWPEARIIGEFDGREKYLKQEWLRDRSAADVVLAEKRREDHLRSEGYRVVRWAWPDVKSGDALRRILDDAGVRRVRTSQHAD